MAKLKITVELEMEVPSATTAELWGKQFEVDLPLHDVRLYTVKEPTHFINADELCRAMLPITIPTSLIKSVKVS